MAIVYGINPVVEALNNAPGRIEQINLLKGPMQGQLGRIARIARDRDIRIVYLDKKTLNRKADSTNHQGVVAILSEFEYSPLNLITDGAGPASRIVVLDSIHDPHNLGAIIRTSVCAGVDGIIIPERNAAGVNATVNKVAAGAVSKARIARVRNISHTLESLKEKGYWPVAIEADADQPLHTIEKDRKLALVFGNENKGIRRLVRQNCDFAVHIPMKGDFDSLNVSVAVGVVLFSL